MIGLPYDEGVAILVMQLGAFGPPEVLTPVERPDPLPGPGQVVVRMAATTVNPTDLSVRTGEVRTRVPDLTLPVVPGWDVSGAVGSVGPDVTRFQPGDRVVGLIPWRETRGRVGAYASAAVCEQAWLAPLATD